MRTGAWVGIALWLAWSATAVAGLPVKGPSVAKAPAKGSSVARTAAKGPSVAKAPAKGLPGAKAPAKTGPAAKEAPRTLQDIHIEGEIPVPQVLFITARDQRRFLDLRHRRYLRTSQQVGEQTVFPSWIGVTGNHPTDARKETPR